MNFRNFNKYIIKNSNIAFIYLVLMSYYFLWDINYNFFTLKYSIFLSIVPFFFIKKDSQVLKTIILIFLFFLIHLLLNTFFNKIPLTFDNLKGLVVILFSLIFVFTYKEKLFVPLERIFEYFPLFIVPIGLIFIEPNSQYHTDLDFKCSYLMYEAKTFKFFFLEYSHYGMIFSSLFLYNLYLLSIKEKNFFKKIIRYLVIILLLVSAFYFGSTTLIVGLIISLFAFLLLFNQLNRKFIIMLIISLIVSVIFFIDKGACSRKLTDISLYVNQVEVQKINVDKLNTIKDKILNQNLKIKNKILYCINLEDNFLSIKNQLTEQEKIIKKEEIKTCNKETLEFTIDLEILNKNKNLATSKLLTNFHIVNMSTQVIIKSITTSYKSFLSNPLGYGINNYEYAYFKFNPMDLTKSFFSIDTYYINYNDAASNLPKLVTEFGLFSLALIFALYVFFSPKYELRYKLILFPLIITQFMRSAGYFNGGFVISLLIILIIYLENNAHKK